LFLLCKFAIYSQVEGVRKQDTEDGPQKYKVTREWKTQHFEELYDIFSSLNTTPLIKSGIMRCVLHVAHMGERIGAYRALVGRLMGIEHSEDLVVNGTIILNWIFKKWDVGMNWIALSQDRNRCWAVMNAVMNLRVP
jgi:hypothetical protein